MPEGIVPFFDSLASQSTIIDDMFAVIPHTNKALVPILCGIYPRINQGEEPDVPGTCLPALLKPFGYRSAFFTPATLAFERKGEMLKNMGFDEAFGDAEYRIKGGFPTLNYFGREEPIMLKPSLEWIDQRLAEKKPFFLTYLTLAPHHPYTIPDSYEDRPFPDADDDFHNYLNAVNYVDSFVADLFKGFEARGMMDNTLFVLLSDHGEAFGEHKLQFHSAVPYDEALHVAAILHSPTLFPKPGHIGGWRQQTDLLPTVVDLLGLKLENGLIPGTTLLEPAPANRRMYHATWVENQSMALRVGPEKFVYHYRRKPMEVYEIDKDPFEKNDLASQHSSEELRNVEMELLTWRRRVNEMYR